ncbi:HNH endonuclease [Candidatus Woesearchaeota archaeon]|nr:HNH endonuclease [Candidatus Woesearchaeota archaeon]
MTNDIVSQWPIPKKSKEILIKNGYDYIKKFHGMQLKILFDIGLDWNSIKRIVGILIDNKVKFGYFAPDKSWNDNKWREFIENLVSQGIVSWKDVVLNTLGELNPPQVGTSIASNENFKKQFPKRKTMKEVMKWFYNQNGKCVNCGTRINIEVDHFKSKDEFIKEGKSPDEADTLNNLQLLCKRCNVIKRESHKFGGLSFATAQATLMWIIFYHRPKTYEEFCDLCRRYGLTMASIRFQEAWAMAIWLKKDGKY